MGQQRGQAVPGVRFHHGGLRRPGVFVRAAVHGAEAADDGVLQAAFRLEGREDGLPRVLDPEQDRQRPDDQGLRWMDEGHDSGFQGRARRRGVHPG